MHHEEKELVAHVAKSEAGHLVHKRETGVKLIFFNYVREFGEEFVRNFCGEVGVGGKKHVFVFFGEVEIPF